MRRIISAIAMATLGGLGAVALPAAGTAATGRIRSVEFTGSSVYEFGVPGCWFAQQSFDATLETHRGDTLHIEGCIDLVGSALLFTGTFAIDSPGRRDITGTVSGQVTGNTNFCEGPPTAGLDFELTPTSESRRPHDPPAPMQLDGVWCSPGVPGVPGPISGTLTGELPPGMG